AVARDAATDGAALVRELAGSAVPVSDEIDVVGADAAVVAVVPADAAVAVRDAGARYLRDAGPRVAEAPPVHADAAIPAAPSDAADTWRARAAFGKAMCLLGSGKTEDAQTAINAAWVHGNRDEITVALGFIAYERGEKDIAYAHLLGAERKQNARVQAALKAWL